MQTVIYDSDAFCVLQLDWARPGPDTTRRGGYEIIDKLSGSEIFLDGAVADGFRARVEQLAQGDADADDFDALLDGFSGLARQPLLPH